MKNSCIKYYLLFATVLICCRTFSQRNHNLSVIAGDEQNAALKKISFKKELSDSSAAKAELKNILKLLRKDGYIMATYDSIAKDSLNTRAYLNTGKKMLWVNLKKGNLDNTLLQLAGYREKTFAGKPVNYAHVEKLRENIITYFENNGYPFASFRLDSIVFSDSSITASINFVRNTKIKIDSIVIRGKIKLTKVYLYNYLGIKPGDLYDESKVSLLSKKIEELLFLREIRPLSIVFNNDKSKIIIYAEKKKNSRFDGVLGVLPNSNTTGKLMLTGEATLGLVNSFYRGETINLSWRKLQTNTQDLKTGFVYPYLLNTPFGADIKFELFKNDTLYLNTVRNIGLRYHFTGSNYIKAFAENHNSSLISTEAFKNSTTLPAYADAASGIYGLEYKMLNLDYLYNPRKGFDIKVSGSAGNRKIKKNANLDAKLYENIKLNSVQYRYSGSLAFYIPLFSKTAIKLGMDVAAIESKNLFSNELFRIGGFKSLRGFDEESITASFYDIATFEYRFIYEQNSYLFAFLNGAYYESRTVNNFIHDTPYGFGAGVCFETKAGIFSLTYALGKQFGNPVYFKSAKIHFGLLNYF